MTRRRRQLEVGTNGGRLDSSHLLHAEIEALTAASLGLAAVGLTGAACALFACVAYFAAIISTNAP